jgi:protein arginine kinase
VNLKNMLRYKMAWARAEGPEHGVVLSSRVRLARNLSEYPFPGRATEASLAAVLAAAFEAAGKSHSLSGAARIRLDDASAVDRLFLVERHLISNKLAASPQHRGILVGDSEVLSLMVNEEDHLRLQGISSGLCLAELFKRVGAADDELAGELEMAFHTDWGYMTSCPTNTGTGLRASCLVHLPALGLAGLVNRVLDGLSRLGVVARGLYGEGTKVMGDFYQISNATALGPSEGEIIQAITRVVEGLLRRENETRSEFVSGEQKLRLEDLVYRSLGALSQARIVSFEETMQHLSYIRLGLHYGWKLPVELHTVNELLVLTQPGHVQMLAGRELAPADRDFLRATLLRRKFGGEKDHG